MSGILPAHVHILKERHCCYCCAGQLRQQQERRLQLRRQSSPVMCLWISPSLMRKAQMGEQHQRLPARKVCA